MASTLNRQVQYINEARDATRRLWDALNDLIVLQREWNAEDYGNTLAAGTGDNNGITAAMVGAAVFDSANAFVTVLNTGVATNLSNLL